MERLRRALQRETSSGQVIREIDGLRCLAIVSVVAFHLLEYLQAKMKTGHYPVMADDWPTRLVHQGFIGVELFFVISGFVVALPFARHHLHGGPRPTLKYYYLRRLTRLEPPYLIALVFWFSFFAVTGLGPARAGKMLEHFPAAATYTHLAVYHELNVIYPAAWSLEMEAQFYLVAPLLVLAFSIRPGWVRRTTLLASAVGMGVAQHWLRPAGQAHGASPLQNLHYFLMGFVLLDLYLTVWKQASTRGWAWAWDAVATAAFAAVPFVLYFHVQENVVVPILFLAGCAGVFRGAFWRAVARNPWVYLTGGMCYTIYLYHPFFMGLTGLITLKIRIGGDFTLNFGLQLLLILPIVVGACAGMFLVTEKPFMRRDWPVRLWQWVTRKPMAAGAGKIAVPAKLPADVKELSSTTN